MLPHCQELDATIQLPTRETKEISRGRSPTRFSDPKFAYKPKPQPMWKKQVMYEEPEDTPVGRISHRSWNYILKTGNKLENSGMVTKIVPVLPTVSHLEEPMSDFYKEPKDVIIPPEKNMEDLEKEQTQQIMSRSLPSKRSKSTTKHFNTSRMNTSARAMRLQRSRMSYTAEPKTRGFTLTMSPNEKMRIMPRPRLGSTMRLEK